MGLERLFKLSVILNLANGFSGPARQVGRSTEDMITGFRSMADSGEDWMKKGAKLIGTATMIGLALMGPVKSTFAVGSAMGEVRSVGMEDLAILKKAALDFSNTWAGTTQAEFVGAAAAIKGGIASLTDMGVAQFTTLAALTAKATRASTNEMTNLFAMGYGIYKDSYKKMNDVEWAEMFAAGLASSIQIYRSEGDQMANAISRLGAAATTAKRPLEEQLAVLGELQTTMEGSEAGTKYKAFLRTAAQAGEELGMSFVDSRNRMLPMVDIIEKLRERYGATLDAMEKLEIQKAFGSDEAVALIDLFYNKTGQLRSGIDELRTAMRGGTATVAEMADAMNQDPAARWELITQRFSNMSETIGNQLLPVVIPAMERIADLIGRVADWAAENPDLTRTIFYVIAAVAAFLAISGTFIGTIGGIRWAYGSARAEILTFGRAVRSAAETGYLRFLYAQDAVKAGLGRTKELLRSGGSAVVQFGRNLWSAATTSLPRVIAATWSWTVALLANPVTWIVLGIIALVGAIILLYRNWDKVSAFLKRTWAAVGEAWNAGIQWVKDLLAKLVDFFSTYWVEILAVILPFIGIPLLIVKHWDSIVAWFSGLWERMKAAAVQGLLALKSWVMERILGIVDWFSSLKEKWFTSGKALLDTFVDGIKSVINRPVEVVKEGLAKVRRLLPFSDAKEGPLSTLTRSGRAMIETLAYGIQDRASLLRTVTAEALALSFGEPQLALAGFSGDLGDDGRMPAGERTVGRLDLREVMREVIIDRERIHDRGDTIHIDTLQLPATPSSSHSLRREMQMYVNSRRKGGRS